MIPNDFKISNCFNTVCSFIENNSDIMTGNIRQLAYEKSVINAGIDPLKKKIILIVIEEKENTKNYITLESNSITYSDIGNKEILEDIIYSIMDTVWNNNYFN